MYGHLDYVVRYGKTKDSEYHYETYRDVLDRILTTLLEKEKGIEINTGAIGYHLKDLNPCTSIRFKYIVHLNYTFVLQIDYGIVCRLLL